MKKRTDGFLSIVMDGERAPEIVEIGDYIKELHTYLWHFVKCEFPFADGDLRDCIDLAAKSAKARQMARQQNGNI